MAALLIFSVSADTLTLPKGQILDFGETVDVLDGSQTYFGRQMKDWADNGDFTKTVETMADGLKGKTEKDTVSLATKAWMDTKVYQIRASTPAAFYETLVISLSVDNQEWKQGKKGFLALAERIEEKMTASEEKSEAAEKKTDRMTADTRWKEVHLGEPYKKFLEKRKIRIYVRDGSHWKEKTSSGGKTYRIGKAKVGVDYDGYFLPLFAEGLIVSDGTSTTYTLFAGDQKSGEYFAPYVEKAAREMK